MDKRIQPRTWIIGIATFVLAASRVPGCEPCDQARALRSEGKPREAVAVLKKAGKDDKASAELNGLLAMCHFELGKPRDATAALTKFLGARPTAEQVAEVREVALASAIAKPPENVVMRTPEGAAPALLLYCSGARYPPDAAEFGIERTVTLDAVIGTDGTAKRIEMRSDANWADLRQMGFEDAAVEALKRWRFFPALRNGLPVESGLTVLGIFEMID